ncbi:MAG: cell division protein ZapA, partial [Spirochaetales bacterium]|nr:cell division protein ZapA [Spirochaetales bacterium]
GSILPDRPELKIDLLGASFSIHSDEEPEYLYKIIDYFREKTAEVRRTAPSADTLKAAILAGIVVADELFKLRADPSLAAPADAAEAARITERLISELSGALSEEPTDDASDTDDKAE